MDLRILGHFIGTVSSWEGSGFVVVAEDFKPDDKYKRKLPATDFLKIDFRKGVFFYEDIGLRLDVVAFEQVFGRD